MQKIKCDSHVPALLFRKESPAPPRWPRVPPRQSHMPAWPQAIPRSLSDHRSAQQHWSSPPPAAGLIPQPGLDLTPRQLSHAPGWAQTPGSAHHPWCHNHREIPAHRASGQVKQREKQKINLKPPTAVCTSYASNSLSKRTKRQTGSKGCAYSSLLQLFQVS